MIKTIIVDDEPMVAEIIRYFVKKGDLPLDIVGTADNGIIAEELIRKYQPDLVFLDIQMPMKNGFEVMRDQPDTKYIIVTAFDTFDYAQRALRLGAMDILLYRRHAHSGRNPGGADRSPSGGGGRIAPGRR